MDHFRLSARLGSLLVERIGGKGLLDSRSGNYVRVPPVQPLGPGKAQILCERLASSCPHRRWPHSGRLEGL
jgi:hypothetical protein